MRRSLLLQEFSYTVGRESNGQYKNQLNWVQQNYYGVILK